MIQLEIFLQTVLSGLLLGGLYALIGLGMAIIMGVMKIINLAHGELMMVAMYIAYLLFTFFGIDPYLSIFVAGPILFGFGVLIQKFLIAPVIKVDSILPENQVILTVGIGMVLASVATAVFTSDYRSTPVEYASTAFYLSDIWRNSPIELSFSLPWVVSFLCAVVITFLLRAFFNKTDMGKSIRATSQDGDAAILMGVNVKRMRAFSFGFGSAIVAAAGCLFLPLYYLFPAIGGQFTPIAFVITVIGGMGSYAGAIVGGIILGIFESLTSTYIGMGWAPVGRFVIFIAVLVFIPGGIASILKRRRVRT